MGMGFMGGFSGRLGPAVGYCWQGRWCLRSLPARVRNPRTERQQAHRMMFRDEVRLAARMAWPIDMTMRLLARTSGMTARNMFMQMNQGAFGWAEGRLAVDWQRLRLSTGPLAPVALGVPQVEAKTLTVSFEKNPLGMRARGGDEVWLYVYCPALEQGCLAAAVHRRAGRVSLLLPDGFEASELWLYAYVSDGMGQFSETCTAHYDGTMPYVSINDNVDTPEAGLQGAASVADDVVGAEEDLRDGAHEGLVVGGADADIVVGPPLHEVGGWRSEV